MKKAKKRSQVLAWDLFKGCEGLCAEILFYLVRLLQSSSATPVPGDDQPIFIRFFLSEQSSVRR
ncbi:MAG: hypothetical protein COV44_10805 [Deltaproteobacteria bacterium CG11_big_fil_rev_8_21_14_0_20_45_16]|nr:MAG: hypothetical protein COV44_10805 [Deltaproteobacteria bacterium CG11_big_fil_rev_8_21_14_0_20_45_16]